jgi:hypothetical protein
LFFLHKSRKAIEVFRPETLIAVQPAHCLLHRPRGQPARHGTAALRTRDQAGVRQHIEMLHDRGQRHRKRLRQFADRNAVLFAEPRQQRPPRRIRQRRKGAVEGMIAILNHGV